MNLCIGCIYQSKSGKCYGQEKRKPFIANNEYCNTEYLWMEKELPEDEIGSRVEIVDWATGMKGRVGTIKDVGIMDRGSRVFRVLLDPGTVVLVYASQVMKAV